ncbi:DUF3784 domain-containing protein [Metasolibacillus meyeri]|uniref:DUF3784 domain-containing protein n=1 Tax=Metasolibacillus meyeri TaxID=1071052 RepID=A0AAW9NZE7_9BACL|nr:DUF3784 domain-containing protein [Metasolibacillus meyeri]MEC1180443.1 DUF3784 domain-containing protein [Metasolibacillus meyeri]
MIWIIIAVILVFLGIATHKLKWYFLISGYNTMSKEQKKHVDVEGLSRFIARYMYIVALLLLALGAADSLGYYRLMTPLVILLIVSAIVLVIKSQKYNHNIVDEHGKLKKGAGKQMKKPAIIIVVTLIGVSILMYFSLQQTSVIATEQQLEVKGVYGGEYGWKNIQQLELIEELPAISVRTNGSAVGTKLKGNFKLENGDKVKLFVDKSEPPFIRFVTDDQIVIFNLASSEETKAMYETMQRYVKE